MPMRGELPTVRARSHIRASAARVAWSRFVATILNPELQFVVCFCLIGYLIAINLILRFPGFGETFAAFAVFP
jgi:hypothetical protein